MDNRVKDCRDKKYLTVFQLAVKAHLSTSTILNTERGVRATLRTQSRLSRALEVPVEELFPDAAKNATTEQVG